MDVELLNALEEKVEALMGAYTSLQRENERVSNENVRLLAERDQFKTRIDTILRKLEEV